MNVFFSIQIRTALITGLILLQACALQGTPVSSVALENEAKAELALQSAAECCSDLTDIVYEPIPVEVIEEQIGLEAELGSATPVYRFGDAKSYFLAWSLPPVSRGLTLEIRSLPTETTLFMPKVLLLDEQYKVVRAISESSFSFVYGSLLEGDRLQANALIESVEKVRYIILYSSPAGLGETTEVLHEDDPSAIPTERNSPPIEDPQLLHVPTGQVVIRIGYLTAEVRREQHGPQ